MILQERVYKAEGKMLLIREDITSAEDSGRGAGIE